MKRIILFITIIVVSFAAGLVGIYFAMPVLDPDGVEQTRSRIDSLLAGTTIEPEDSLRAEIISLPIEPLALTDSLSASSDSVHAVPLDEHPRYLAILDSLNSTKADVARLDRERANLLTRLETLESERALTEEQRVEAADLSATLTRLEDQELRDILTLLDERALTSLYNEASGRSRTRILASLSSDRAARLVQRMMAGSAPTSGLYTSDPRVQ